MKKFIFIIAAVLSAITLHAKTLIVYYSFTNNVHTIANDLQSQTGADIVRIEPAQEGLDYAANGYAIGSALISAIRNNPTEASSYPEIKNVDVNLDNYDMIIVAAPLWWSNMAAPLQTYLFHNGAKMSGKKIGLIVSSASSGISGVEADAHRLVPGGDFVTPSLWIRSSQTSSCHSMISDWLNEINYSELTSGIDQVGDIQHVNLSIVGDKLVVDGEFDSLSLYSLTGKKVLESSDKVVATGSLSRGLYIARVDNDTKSASKKVVIK